MFEMDLFRLLNSGYLIEYEVKISKQDFQNDMNKGYSHYTKDYTKLQVKKHDLLKEKKYVANRFYYVVPRDLIKKEEVPEYAGLMYYEDGYFEIIRTAPLLHRNKNFETKYKELCRKLCFRDYNRKVERYIKFKQKMKIR